MSIFVNRSSSSLVHSIYNGEVESTALTTYGFRSIYFCEMESTVYTHEILFPFLLHHWSTANNYQMGSQPDLLTRYGVHNIYSSEMEYMIFTHEGWNLFLRGEGRSIYS